MQTWIFIHRQQKINLFESSEINLTFFKLNYFLNKIFKIYENENLEWKQLQSILNFPFSSERVPVHWSFHFYFFLIEMF